MQELELSDSQVTSLQAKFDHEKASLQTEVSQLMSQVGVVVGGAKSFADTGIAREPQFPHRQSLPIS